MKKAIKQKFPPGWDEQKVRAVADYYDHQTDDEAAAEIEAADEVPNQTWMSVPTELVPTVTRLIAAKASNSRPRRKPRTRAKKGRKAPAR